MKFWILHSVFVFMFFGLYAQPVFNEVYDLEQNFDVFIPLTECNNGEYLTAGQSRSFVENDMYSFMARIDSNGDLVWKKKLNIKLGSFETINDIRESNNNLIYLVGVYPDSALNFNSNSFLIVMNEVGDSLFALDYNDSIINTSSKILIENNKYYILQWNKDNDTTSYVYSRILIVDSLGAIEDIWEIHSPLGGAYQDFKKVGSEFILSGVAYSDSLNGNIDFKLVKLDSVGNILWENTYGTSNDETTRNYNYLAVTQDGGFVMCGEEDLGGPTNYQGVILKVNNDGQLLWRKSIIEGELTISNSIREWENGSLVVASNFTNYDTVIPFFNDPRGHLMKLSADGEDIIWERTFSKWNLDENNSPGGASSQDYVHGMILTSDGGILVSGYQIHPFATNNDGWLIKFDSCGYTVGAQPQAEFIIDSIVGPQVYITNLSEDYCIGNMNISLYNPLTGDTLQLDSLHVYAYSEYSNGTDPTQLVYTLPDTGTYIFSLHTYAGDGEDVFSASIQVSDISTSISEVPNIVFSVYPNPASDYLIITSSPLLGEGQGGEAKTQAHFYTTTGQLVKTLILNPRLYQERLYIGDLSNGVYLMQFVVEGQALGFERVSVVK